MSPHFTPSSGTFEMKGDLRKMGTSGEFCADIMSDRVVARGLRAKTGKNRGKRGSALLRHPAMAAKTIKVLCVTPYGTQGRGGIDRLYYYLRRCHNTDAPVGIEMSYFIARGSVPGNLWILTFPWRAILFAIRMIELRPDIVHLNFSIGGSVYRKYVLLLIAKALGARTVLHFHGQFTTADVASGARMVRCIRDMCHRATRIIVLGNYYRAAFVDTLGIPAEKLEVLANGIPDFARERALPKPRRPKVNLLFIGELGLRKGTDILVDALAQLALRTHAWSCIIAGNGDAEPYRARIAGTKCGDLVRFAGWLDAEDVGRLLADCDIVILPSRAETLPLSLIEGACAGAALVATAVGEVAEVLHEGRNGILVDTSAAAVANALERLIERREELAAMQVESRLIYRDRFNIKAFTEGLSGIYGRLMKVRR